MDESAYLVRLSALRLRILRYLRGTTQAGPWVANSQFKVLERDLHHFADDLPECLSFSSTALFFKKRTGRIVSFLTLHVFLRQLYCDLYQVDGLISRMPTTDPAPASFLQRCRLDRLTNALAVCSIIGEALPHRGVAMDPFLGTCAFQACKSLLYQRQHDEPELAIGVTESAVLSAFETGLNCMRRLATSSAVCRQYVGYKQRYRSLAS